jgi:hypothetical protein
LLSLDFKFDVFVRTGVVEPCRNVLVIQYDGSNKPAIIYDGTMKWYRHDKLHREHGPAIITNDRKIWYLDGAAWQTEI